MELGTSRTESRAVTNCATLAIYTTIWLLIWFKHLFVIRWLIPFTFLLLVKQQSERWLWIETMCMRLSLYFALIFLLVEGAINCVHLHQVLPVLFFCYALYTVSYLKLSFGIFSFRATRAVSPWNMLTWYFQKRAFNYKWCRKHFCVFLLSRETQYMMY